MIRIIDHKKVDMTDSEWQVYQNILASYDQKLQPATFFQDLFETDKNGLIIFLKPPNSNKLFTMEIWLFLTSLMQNQHLRQIYLKTDQCISEIKKEMAELREMKNKKE